MVRSLPTRADQYSATKKDSCSWCFTKSLRSTWRSTWPSSCAEMHFATPGGFQNPPKTTCFSAFGRARLTHAPHPPCPLPGRGGGGLGLVPQRTHPLYHQPPTHFPRWGEGPKD